MSGDYSHGPITNAPDDGFFGNGAGGGSQDMTDHPHARC